MTVAELPIKINRGKIADFCRAHSIRKLSLFGSVVHDDFDPKRSDVDVLVEFLPNQTPGWEFFRFADELAPILGRSVDLNTPSMLSQYFREEVLREAVTIYEQA